MAASMSGGLQTFIHHSRARGPVGSSKDQVLSAQGQPTSIIGDTWSYNFSSVYFDGDGLVNGYSIIDPALNVVFIVNESSKSAFSIGSTKDEVMAIQGVPSSIIYDIWSYGLSSVYFDSDNRVSGYSVIDEPLKVRP